MVWAAIGAAAVGVVGGAIVNSGSGNRGSGGTSSQASAAADPFAGERPVYQQKLRDLMENPSSYQQSAASKTATQTGMSAIDANMAAKGLGNSGAQQTALTKYATDMAGADYQTQMSNLMQLSGATGGSPAAAGSIMANTGQQNTAALGALGSVAGQGLSNYMNQPNNSPTDMTGFQTQSQPIQYQPSQPAGNVYSPGTDTYLNY